MLQRASLSLRTLNSYPIAYFATKDLKAKGVGDEKQYAQKKEAEDLKKMLKKLQADASVHAAENPEDRHKK